MNLTELTLEQLAALLREAEQAHGAYERTLGHRDDNWPDWYAAYMLDTLHGGQHAQDESATQMGERSS
jgi:hypothetical protein